MEQQKHDIQTLFKFINKFKTVHFFKKAGSKMDIFYVNTFIFYSGASKCSIGLMKCLGFVFGQALGWC